MFNEDTRRNLPRLLFGVAAVGYVLSTFLPWAVGEAVGMPVQYAAYEGGAGVWFVLLAAALTALGVSGALTEATSRIFQVIPLLIAVIAVFMWQGADTQAHYAITSWTNQVGHGEMTAVRWLCIAAIAATGLAWLLLEIWRPAEVRRRMQPLTRELGFNRWGLGTVVAAAAGGLLGGMAGLYVIIVPFGSKVAIFGLVSAVVGMFLGGAIGVRLVRLLRSVVTHA